jgi:hypothetical protein
MRSWVTGRVACSRNTGRSAHFPRHRGLEQYLIGDVISGFIVLIPSARKTRVALRHYLKISPFATVARHLSTTLALNVSNIAQLRLS